MGRESRRDVGECYSDTPVYNNRCGLYSNTIVHTEGRMGSPPCFLVSPALHQCPLKNVAPEKVGEEEEGGGHQFIILLDLEMNIPAHTYVTEPKQRGRNRIVMHESRNTDVALSDLSAA